MEKYKESDRKSISKLDCQNEALKKLLITIDKKQKERSNKQIKPTE